MQLFLHQAHAKIPSWITASVLERFRISRGWRIKIFLDYFFVPTKAIILTKAYLVFLLCILVGLFWNRFSLTSHVGGFFPFISSCPWRFSTVAKTRITLPSLTFEQCPFPQLQTLHLAESKFILFNVDPLSNCSGWVHMSTCNLLHHILRHGQILPRAFGTSDFQALNIYPAVHWKHIPL